MTVQNIPYGKFGSFFFLFPVFINKNTRLETTTMADILVDLLWEIARKAYSVLLCVYTFLPFSNYRFDLCNFLARLVQILFALRKIKEFFF